MSTPINKARRIRLLPEGGPRFHAHEGTLPDSALEALSAIVVLLELDAPLPSRLPQAAAWRALLARTAPKHGETRVTTLAPAHRCVAVLAWCRADATAFERLTVAGRAVSAVSGAGEFASRVAVAAGAPDAARRVALLEALCAAAGSSGFALPSLRTDVRKVERVEVLGAAGLDLARVQASVDAANLARHLTALPPNVLDAAAYRNALKTLSRRHGLALRWYDEAALRKAGCGAFLAVTAGSGSRDAGIAHVRWRPRGRRLGDAPDVALVGKGIVFDTGGTNLKAHRGMLDMHTDMAGSAVALSVLTALAALEAPIAADAWLAITDNAIGPHASRPQDVVVAANGTSIQLIHTDAEGRLVLADTLALAGRTSPKLMLDYATLTGACVTALTERRSGLFANRADLQQSVSAAGDASGERVWPFPLDADYDSDLDSKVADIAQCAVDGKGDHILAARFLQRFVPEGTPWAHLDLSSATRKGGLAHVSTEETGFGVRLTLSLLLDAQAASA